MNSSNLPPDRTPSQAAPAVLALFALVIGLVAGLLSWFVVSGTGFSLLNDSYHAMYIYGTQGSGALRSNSALGSTLYNASTSNPIVLITFAIVLFFWPAMLVSGVFSIALRSFGPYPFVWGLIAFIFAYLMVYFAGDTLGIGGYLDLVAAILFLVATLTVRRAKAAPAPPIAGPPTAAPTTSSPAESAASSPPKSP